MSKFNSLHQSLKFTIEKEENNSLPFLDVSAEKTEPGFLTSVYSKPTFSGLYTRWGGGVTHISKDNVREKGYYQANCIVYLPK